MKFTARLNTAILDLNGYKNALDAHMRDVISQALFEWLDTVLKTIPIWSGASYATFTKLAAKIGYPTIIVPVANSRIGRGESQGTADMTMQIDTGRYTFTYGTTLPWLVWNEYHNANLDPDPTKWPPPAELIHPGPYGFQEIGKEAFLKFAESVRLPSVAPFVKARQVRG